MSFHEDSERLSQIINEFIKYESIYYIGSITILPKQYKTKYSDIDILAITNKSIKGQVLKSCIKECNSRLSDFRDLSNFKHISIRVVNEKKLLEFEKKMYLWGYDMNHSINIDTLKRDYKKTDKSFYFSPQEQLNSILESIWYIVVRTSSNNSREKKEFYEYINSKWNKQLLNFINIFNLKTTNLFLKPNLSNNILLFKELLSHIISNINQSSFHCTYLTLNKAKYNQISDFEFSFNLIKFSLNYLKPSLSSKSAQSLQIYRMLKVDTHYNPSILIKEIEHIYKQSK